ncbi:hypothetical protein AMTR_s00078p00176050 [Amborella trichopoda]|uniref:non-specific serine/threonine protein kinase n=3 Tax=Amborella trichopoda TaxID=13333 RepID=W1P7J1_AMBTC|nr:hypothetical protein AMTR_s00078p00176050 [Amborella trichopoda]
MSHLVPSSFMMELYFIVAILSAIAVPEASVASPSPSSGSSKDTLQLLSFKGTVQNPYPLQNWRPNQDPCYFNGVACKDSRVSSIDLSNQALSTDFKNVASFLLNLEKLETLSLNFANISGSVTSQLVSSCSKSLTELDLAGNGFSGEVPAIASLSSCENLKALNLSRNSLSFSAAGTFSGGSSLKFQSLDLSYNQISGAGIFSWLFSGDCETLEYLDLRGNRVAGNVSAIVSGCPNLEFLDLSANNFSGELPALGSLTLKHLDLSQNSFSGDIEAKFSGYKELTFLNLSVNQFSGGIPADFGRNLQYLNLSGNGLVGEIPSQLSSSCSNLLQLDISYNNISGPIPLSLSSCALLESIDLSNNSLSGPFPIQSLSAMANLKKLVLSYNYISGYLPDSLSNLSSLQLLDLSSNSISGTIPGNLCKNPETSETLLSLRELYLQNNLLSGTIPETLSNCSELVSLDLSFNYLKGTIPRSLGSLQKLQDLIMWLNQLEGEIPQELSNLHSLSNLILDNNGLTGNLPSGLSNCANLNWISLSSNRLSGPIPPWIGKLSKLAILQLGNNSLSGPIPQEIGDCKSLIWLDLNSNNLSGLVPGSIANQSGNIAAGLVTGKTYAYLRNDGSSNCHGAGNLLEMAGIRTENLARVPTRRSCNFTRIYLGKTSYTFKNNGSMIFLDLSYNQLSGEIPAEIGSIYYLSVLNLGHNRFSGQIPANLGRLKNVGILDLSHNELSGPIPPSFSALSGLSDIDLSNNNLTGSIPELGQLATFPAFRYENNSGLCGFPLPSCDSDSSGLNGSVRPQGSHRRQASLAGSVAMGLLFSLFCIFGLIIVAIESQKRRKKQSSNVYIDSLAGNGNTDGTTMVGGSGWKFSGGREALSINLAAFEKPLRKLTFADLLEATNGFHGDSLIGSGGFGDVYKAQLRDGSVAAIKKLIHVSGQGDREFTAEMETIGKIKHRNLVPLLGYCKVGEERLLVYEYMKHGSLEDVLHHRKNGAPKLDWPARRKIAVGAARGLAFLHHSCIPHIIHR